MQMREKISIQSVDVSDGVLARQTLDGDQYAFESLVHRYSTPLFNFIYRFLGDYDQACDILQHVFIQLHTSLPTLRTDKPLKAWLFQVARNRCLDELRRRHAIHFSELEIAIDDEYLSPLAAIPDNSPLPEELAEQSDLQEHLQTAIQTLPIKFRSVVLLRYAGQLSFSECGQTLNMSKTTAKTYIKLSKSRRH